MLYAYGLLEEVGCTIHSSGTGTYPSVLHLREISDPTFWTIIVDFYWHWNLFMHLTSSYLIFEIISVCTLYFSHDDLIRMDFFCVAWYTCRWSLAEKTWRHKVTTNQQISKELLTTIVYQIHYLRGTSFIVTPGMYFTARFQFSTSELIVDVMMNSLSYSTAMVASVN